MNYTNFYYDYEKMLDYRILSKEEFLQSYSYLTEEEYELTNEIVEKNGGVNSYEVSKHILDTIRSKDEILFRMAISHWTDVGGRHLTDENVEYTCDEIMKQDDSHSFMTNGYQCDIVRTAAQLARIDHIHLLVYISQNVFYDCGQKKMTYDRTSELLNGCMDWISQQEDETSILHKVFDWCGFYDEELEQLGYGYVLPEEEDE